MDYIYASYDMESEHDKYWHIQMHKPEGPQSELTIRSRDLLEEPQPVIGTSEWDSKQCEDFKHIPEGSIVLVREGKKAIALCRITGPNRSDTLYTTDMSKSFASSLMKSSLPLVYSIRIPLSLVVAIPNSGNTSIDYTLV